MTAPDDADRTDAPAASTGPVSHTDARHIALATVAAGSVSYDREHATWTLRTRNKVSPDIPLRGHEQRTLRDLHEYGLIVYAEGEGPAPVRTTSKGNGALALWGPRRERLRGA
jgi:hypothetical protein